MDEFWTLIRKDLLELRRSRKLLILIVLFLFVAVSSPITAKLMPEILKSVQTPGLTIRAPDPTYLDAVAQFVKNMSQLAMLVVIFLAAGAVVDEKNRKNLEILLTKPVSRRNFILAKFASLLGTVGLVFLAASALFFAYAASLFSGLSAVNFLLADLLILLYLLLTVAVTVTASTVARHPLGAAGLGFLWYAGLSIVSAIASRFARFLPDYILSKYADVVKTGWKADLGLPTAASLLLIVALVVLSVTLFKKQEIER